jgi:hypothetical protein
MENNIEKTNPIHKPEPLSKETFNKMIWCLALSLFWVVFIWGFWSRGVYALGMNAFVFMILTLLLFVWILYSKKYNEPKELYWTIPLALISFAYLIYDNPFIKIISLLVFAAGLALFINYGFLRGRSNRHWDINFIFHILKRAFSFLGKIGDAFNSYFDLLSPKHKQGRRVIAKSIVGIILFLIIASSFIIPLLSSADPVFAGKVDAIYSWIGNIISVTLIYRILFFIILSIALLASVLAWGKSYEYKEKEESGTKIDPIISGIVLGGILALYLLFLWVQIARLWVGSLPFDFKETENLVKSGFWQLFFLSIINILIYFFTYRKTVISVQRILMAFTITSLLLLFSAGHRMFLYVKYYGLSYEKFFASYTVLYCTILFVWLISRLFIKQRANILKFLVFLFIWMFSVIAILPVEQIILRTNVTLSKLKDSRINLIELTMLSPDVLSLVKKYYSEGILKEPVETKENKNTNTLGEKTGWALWIEQQEKLIADKKWYEKNIMNLMNK